ncbi:hypothetical protein DQ04_09411000 [Trypanosoma grayi]|uniref:hypothetical protein n=1 Tax=Trypanosoma grayi TaxID=71804 RepID=UPI0004F463DA|nr:hypothetical protein DQ04_09411000 [Trypanosoma grayi]KEG07566.1 hypothetical protein DQ04_09411000 [Trypanosoma grayi]
MEDKAQQKAVKYLQQEREEMQAMFDDKFSELYDDQQRWETQRSVMHEQLAAQYADRFAKAKADMQQHLFNVMSTMLSYQEQCEADWLQTRAKELADLSRERAAYRQLVESHKATDMAQVQAQVEAALRAERDALAERERIMQQTLQANRKAIEDGAMQHAARLLEAHERVLAEASRKHAQEQQEKWGNLQNTLLEKTWEMEAGQQAVAQQLQREHEAVLQKERQRWKTEAEQQRVEAQGQQQRLVERLRQQEVELRSKHETVIEEERRRHDTLVAELRKEHDRRFVEDRQRSETTLREREAAFEAERRRLVERMEKQNSLQQESTNERIRALKDEYNAMMRNVAEKSQQSQQEYLMRVTELEEQHLHRLQEQEQELQRKYDESLTAVRTALEMRVREQAVLEVDAQRRLEEQRESLREEVEVKYRAFIEEQLDRVRAEQKEREAAAQRLEQMYHSNLAELRRDMEETLSSYFAQSDSQSREAATRARSDFENKLQQFYGLVEQERKQHAALEEQLREAQAQTDALRLTHEQQKLAALREMQERYERLYQEMHEACRTEREELARRALGEEEQRLLRELTALEERRRRHSNEISPYTSTPAAAATTTTGRCSSLHEGSPASRLQRVAEEAASHHLLRSAQRTPQNRGPTDDHAEVASYIDDDKLRQLWSVLEVPEAEQQQTLRRWAHLPPQQRAVEVQKEKRQLELQLPLLEVVTRREFVLHRLRELEKSPSSSNGSISGQMEELHKELLRLTEHLKTEIPRHEAMYGCTFRFRGTRYMNTLLNDVSAQSF